MLDDQPEQIDTTTAPIRSEPPRLSDAQIRLMEENRQKALEKKRLREQALLNEQ